MPPRRMRRPRPPRAAARARRSRLRTGRAASSSSAQRPAHAAAPAVPDEPRAGALRPAAAAHEPLPAPRRRAPRARHGQPPLLRAHDAERLGSRPAGTRVRLRAAPSPHGSSARTSPGASPARRGPSWVMRAWMHSPPHRHNILSRQFRDVGIGVARGVPVRGFRGVRAARDVQRRVRRAPRPHALRLSGSTPARSRSRARRRRDARAARARRPARRRSRRATSGHSTNATRSGVR